MPLDNHGVNEMAEQMNFQDRVNKAVQDALAAALPQVLAAVSQKAAPVTSNGNGETTNPGLAKRHAAILAGFKRRGYKDAKLFVDIKPYRTWFAEGRQVRKGEKSVRGLFHVKQTDPIAKKAN